MNIRPPELQEKHPKAEPVSRNCLLFGPLIDVPDYVFYEIDEKPSAKPPDNENSSIIKRYSRTFRLVCRVDTENVMF